MAENLESAKKILQTAINAGGKIEQLANFPFHMMSEMLKTPDVACKMIERFKVPVIKQLSGFRMLFEYMLQNPESFLKIADAIESKGKKITDFNSTENNKQCYMWRKMLKYPNDAAQIINNFGFAEVQQISVSINSETFKRILQNSASFLKVSRAMVDNSADVMGFAAFASDYEDSPADVVLENPDAAVKMIKMFGVEAITKLSKDIRDFRGILTNDEFLLSVGKKIVKEGGQAADLFILNAQQLEFIIKRKQNFSALISDKSSNGEGLPTIGLIALLSRDHDIARVMITNKDNAHCLKSVKQ